ncbi:MAG: Gfo/Idh/MocA family oxidoreductase [Nitrospinae bacterium]|nr:Gfo/Idh/MocA family oxidoreductase [Nitrospinota bacterium]
MSDPLRLGLVGAGFIARQHLEVIAATPGVEAVGIASRTREKAVALAAEFGVPTVADDMAALVAETTPDALMILVSAGKMHEVTDAALDFRLPLFIEKPPGLSVEEAEALAGKAARLGVPHMVGFNRRFYSIFRKGIEIVASHGCGKLMTVAIEGHERIWKPKKNPQFTSAELDGWIYANGTHTLDLLRFFGGEVATMSVAARRVHEANGDQFAALVEFESGALGQYTANWHSPGGWSVTLYGDGVTVKFQPLEKGTWTDTSFTTRDIEPDAEDIAVKPGFTGQMNAFVTLLREGRLDPPAQDLDGAAATMRLAQRLVAAVKPR